MRATTTAVFCEGVRPDLLGESCLRRENEEEQRFFGPRQETKEMSSLESASG